MLSPSDPDAAPVVSLNDRDDNVWASSSSSDLHRHFTPSFNSQTGSSHSLHKRRTSENLHATSLLKDPWRIQHSRAESSDGARGHPLKRDPGGFFPPVFNDPTVTRPILNLRLSPGPTVDVDKNPFEEEHGLETGSGEREELVHIHEVTTTDSLQGVSLKYGISMADLRKANQMWPSDSIHLRKSLNVPVNKASKLRRLNVDGPKVVQRTNSSSSSSMGPLEIMPDIRRIPASHLSFFPQGSPSDDSPANTVVTMARRPRISSQFNSSGSGSLSLTPNTNPSSIFSTLPRAFPIAKDAIMSRLSLDSGGTPPKEEQGHEMGVVGRNSGANDTCSGGSGQGHGAGADPRTTSRTSDHGLRDRRQTRPRDHDAYRTGGEERERASTVVRTSQLEPSPEMLVPALGQKRVQWDQGSSL